MRGVPRFLIAAAGAGAPGLAAQQAATIGTISGSVIDAITASPLAQATVTLTSPDGFSVLIDARGASPMTLARTVTTSAAGEYRFADLPIGAYRLRVQRMGYEATTIDVRLGESGTSALSIGLVVLPVRLRPVEVRARDSRGSPDAQATSGAEDPRIAAARERQETFLSTDARELSLQDIAESATLGGRDVLRSLERLPGVSPFDDWSAKLWIRGNRWDHNRVYFDGVPLFDPLGMLGRTSGVSADAIGGAFLHPGVRPVSLTGDGATRIDLRSRPAAGGSDWRGSAEVSPFGASASVERGRADTSGGVLVTAQQSLGQWLPRGGAFSEALEEHSYRDTQATLRTDVDLGGAKRVEASGVFARDARVVPTASGGDATNQDWSNAAGRVTFSAPLGPVTTAQTVSVSSFASRSDRFLADAPSIAGAPPVNVRAVPVESGVDYLAVGGRITPSVASSDLTTVGYDIISQRSTADGTHQNLALGDPTQALASRHGSLTYGSLWADRRAAFGDRFIVENGLRLDVGGSRGLDAVRPSGSAQALVAVSPNTRLSAGASRVHQYVQGIDLPVFDQGQTVATSWLTSGDDVPMMSVDNLTAGVEQWVTPGVLVAANAYVRRTTGAIADDPTPGPLVQRPLFVTGTESADGVELSARKLVGRATGLVAYSYGNATMRAMGFTYPATANRTHALDAAASVHLGNFNLGGAYTLASGAPFTRIVPGTVSATVREAPNAQRLPNYASLDLSADYMRVMGRMRLIAFAGAQNVLGRANATWYEISGYCDNGQSQPVASPQCRDHDLFETPVKLSPTVGLRLVVR